MASLGAVPRPEGLSILMALLVVVRLTTRPMMALVQTRNELKRTVLV